MDRPDPHTEGGYYYTAYNFAAAEHGGTHLDAPIHFAEGRLTADQLSALEHRHRGEDAPKTRLLPPSPVNATEPRRIHLQQESRRSRGTAAGKLLVQ